MTVTATQTTPFTSNDSFGVGRSDEAQQIRKLQRKAFLDFQRGRAVPPPLRALSPAAREAVDARWGDVCEAMFEYLAVYFPGDLANLVSSKVLPPPTLTFAAEALSGVRSGEAARMALLPLLDDARALIREGAVYGLRNHVDSTVLAKLRRMAKHDTSPGVRQAARDTLAAL